jgi:3-deoxy-D-manno-octulosonate cytidylyltransferase
MRVLAVIPARYGSTRLPGKPLSMICGKPMIQRVYERVQQAKGIDSVLVATDDEKIRKCVLDFGGDVLLTSPLLQSGTDRVAAIADQITTDFYVNIQGDEPLIEPEVIERALELVTSGRYEMGTVMSPLVNLSDLNSPSVVKVVADRQGKAIYFSRLPIPHSSLQSLKKSEINFCSFVSYRHMGIYAYTRRTLLKMRSLPLSPLEKAEGLEQLRAIDHGISIGIVEVISASQGVDTQEDLEKVRNILGEANKND